MVRFTLLSLLLVSPLFAQTASEKKATIAFLASLQQGDGGFIPAPQDPNIDAAPRSSLRATSGAVRTIQYLGGEVPNAAKALKFVQSCYSPDSGAFSDMPGGKVDSDTTAIGMMAMAALEKEPKLDKSIEYLVKNAKSFEERRLAVAGMEAAMKFAPAVKEWLAEIEKTKNKDGTFGTGEGKARATGGITAMILRSGGKLEGDRRKNILAALRDGQRPDGGFGQAEKKISDPSTTYRVMRAFHLLNEKPKDPAKMKAYLASFRNADGGYCTKAGEMSSVSGTYYAVIVMKWLGN